MSNLVLVSVDLSGVTRSLDLLGRAALDLGPAMRRIEKEIISPLIGPAWQRSGLIARSGALRDAVTPWSGKRSAGVTLKARRGSYDKGLVHAKAAAHTLGRKKWSSKRAVYKAGLRVSKKTGKLKWSKRAHREWVEVKSPWGDIPARPFFPKESTLLQLQGRMEEIIQEHLHAATP